MLKSKHAVLTRLVLLPAALLITFSMLSFGQTRVSPSQRAAHADQMLSQEVRHQLLLLPWYSVFDNLEYKVANGVVTLQGQVVQDRTKEDAEKYVKGIEGVTRVVNNIEILPASPNDDQIRRAEYRAIFGEPQLEKYSFGSVQPVHIIVKGGHVTLEGVVLNDGDRNLANIRANGVPGVFSVTNNLRVENSKNLDGQGGRQD
jgi:hyperosmotically inducible periplasmic protein